MNPQAIWNVEPQSWPTLVMRSCAWLGSTTIFVARGRARAPVTGRVAARAAPVASAATAILAMAL